MEAYQDKPSLFFRLVVFGYERKLLETVCPESIFKIMNVQQLKCKKISQRPQGGYRSG
jgi:hypothetical protein